MDPYAWSWNLEALILVPAMTIVYLWATRRVPTPRWRMACWLVSMALVLAVTVTLELRAGEQVLASLPTVLEPEQTSEARKLAHELRRRLEDGSLEPTAGAIEPLADSAG